MTLLGGNDRSQAHQPIGQRHERFAALFGLDPTHGRHFIATALRFRGLTLDEGPVLRLERRYDHPAERIWRALTNPDEQAQWFHGEIEVTHSDPPRLLLGSWTGGTLRFELPDQHNGCVLIFTHTFTDRDQAALAAAGWDRCFARLDAPLAEHPMSEPAVLAAWLDVHERYATTGNINPEIGRTIYTEHLQPELQSAES